MGADGSNRTIYTFENGFAGGTNPGWMRAPR
jgi:hypothetical protein